MTVTALEYEDRQRHWKLERTEFGPFNLLVGVSGAGKTSVLDALTAVSVMASSGPGARHPEGERRWCIEVQADDGRDYRWEAQIEVDHKALEGWREDRVFFPAWPVRFLRERITVGGDPHGELITREPDAFRFSGKSLPRLKDTESAISLLAKEAAIAPLHRALHRILVSDSTKPFKRTAYRPSYEINHSAISPLPSVDVLREAPLSIVVKAYLARLHFPDLFESIRSHYGEIFDSVVDLTVDFGSDLDFAETHHEDWHNRQLTVAIKERGVRGWITARHISSGMLRTFFHLAELELSPPGTTIVIDEYENGMGVNCLPAVTEIFVRRQHELQLVLTSHHPYIIQNIPIDWWRVVTRRGGVVSVRPAREIPELSTSSRQDAFTLLVNSSVYEEGIQ